MATVLSISACPEIKKGRSRVVTGTVSHFNGFVKQLWFDNAIEPIEPTDVHPFYSLDRNDWVKAKDLRINETVRTATGRSMLRRSKWRGGVHRVYNIEVERENVYYAGAQELLVHNGCISISKKQLQKKYEKHASDFGVNGNYNKQNAAKFKKALEDHVASKGTSKIEGKYRGDDVIHYYDKKTGLNVITKPDGTFVSGWKLNKAQRSNIEKTGSIGGG